MLPQLRLLPRLILKQRDIRCVPACTLRIPNCISENAALSRIIQCSKEPGGLPFTSPAHSGLSLPGVVCPYPRDHPTLAIIAHDLCPRQERFGFYTKTARNNTKGFLTVPAVCGLTRRRSRRNTDPPRDRAFPAPAPFPGTSLHGRPEISRPCPRAIRLRAKKPLPKERPFQGTIYLCPGWGMRTYAYRIVSSRTFPRSPLAVTYCIVPPGSRLSKPK